MRHSAGLHGRVGDDAGVDAEPRAATACGRDHLRAVVAGELDEQPGAARAAAAARRRRRGRARRSTQPGVEALARRRAVRDHGGHGLAGGDDVGEAEHHHARTGASTTSRTVASSDHAEGALGADQGAVERRPFSGSRCWAGSRETWRPNRPSSVRACAEVARRRSSRRGAAVPRVDRALAVDDESPAAASRSSPATLSTVRP